MTVWASPRLPPSFYTWSGSFLPAVKEVIVQCAVQIHPLTSHLYLTMRKSGCFPHPLAAHMARNVYLILIHISTFNSIFFLNGFTNKFLYSCVRAHALLLALYLNLFMSLFGWWNSVRPRLLRISKRHFQGLWLINRYFLGIHGEPGRSENEWWRYRTQPHQVHRQDHEFTE